MFIITKLDINPSAGIGDPYWYEWTIGQKYVVDMLNPDNQIDYVILQATEAQGLDDVVVVYSNGTSEYVQVKHTRAEDTLTFGNMLSLLKSMSTAWATQKNKWVKCSPVLFTNRILSTNSSNLKDPNGKEQFRPALNMFLLHFQSEIAKANSLNDIGMPKEWAYAWEEWHSQLSELSSDEDKLEFLKLLVIKTEQLDLNELTSLVTQKISTTFGISAEKATSLFGQLDHALRNWVTTSRGQKESIYCEDVYEVLSMQSQELVGDHMLLPPEPFFPSRMKFLENLAEHLLKSSCPVTFLSGAPGQGKTSVVSALANRRDPVIDLRFHAFKPITPQTLRLHADSGTTTKAEVLWGDLLIELRSYFFKRRLAKFNVPIRNDFLSLEQLISEVLRLANILGEERGRPTIIAIDGIDHAARAGVDQYSFLETLIPPDAVPDHVRFLIVGQPSDSYDKYPFWLKGSEQGVSHWVVEGIQEEDISQLLTTEIPMLPADQFQVTLRLICNTAKENTLTAIFAIEEAKTVSDLGELQLTLSNRRLTDGISEYYEKIWNSAVVRLDNRFPFVGQRLASYFSLTKERVTGNDLARIFADVMEISSIDWVEALRALRPLVIEENEGFRVTHNDVRVHLTKEVHDQPERLREVASLIADYYWGVKEKEIARHSSLFELLRKSNRHADQARVFTPEYVMEGIAYERPLEELYNQCQQALLYAAETKDWDCIHSVSCATATLVQLHKSVDWTGRDFKYVPDVPPLLFSEGRVLNQELWTLESVHDTITDAYHLVRANEYDRAKSLMRRWLADITPVGLACMFEEVILDQISDNKYLNDTFKNLLHLWGQVSFHTGLQWTEEIEPKPTDNRINKETWACFSNAMMKEAIEYGDLRDWIWTRQVSVYNLINDMEKNLMQLAEQKKWAEIAYTLKESIGKRDQRSSIFQIKAAALSLLTGRNELINYWVQSITDKGFNIFEDIDLDDYHEDQTLLYCMVSFVLGWTQPFRENGGIGEEGVKAYYAKKRNERQKAHLSTLLYGSALAGKWLGSYRNRGSEIADQIVTSNEIRLVLEAVVRKTRNFNETVHKEQPSTKWIVEIFIECANLIGGVAGQTVNSFILDYSKSYPVNYMMEIGWRYLWDRGEETLLVEWFLHWCADEGIVWQLELAERVDIVNRMANLANEVGYHQEAERAQQLLKWGLVGYTGHKEYVLDSPQDWYRELAKGEPEVWVNEGKRLIEICQVVSELGDNRLSLFVEGTVASSVAYDGPKAMWKLLNAQNIRESLIDNPHLIIDGLISLLKSLVASETELLTIWSFGIGTLNWQDGYERCYLEDLRNALCLAAERNGISCINDKLKSLGPAEYHIKGERDRYRIPIRWFESIQDESFHRDEQKNELYEAFQELPVQKAIDRLIQTNELADRFEILCKGINIISKRLLTEKPSGYPKHLQRLVDLLLAQNYKAQLWSDSSIRLAHQALVPLIRDNVRFELLRNVISNLDFETEERIWLDSAVKKIDELCRFRALSSGSEDLKAGVNRLLNMHELWIQGAGHLPNMQRIEFPDFLVTTPSSWSEFAIRYFLRILESNNLTRIGLALRGLWSIAQISPCDLKYIAENWSRLSYSCKERVLLVVERAAANAPLAYEAFSEIVRTCYDGVELGLKLQAWVILNAIERRTGEICPEWVLPKSPDHEALVLRSPTERGILDTPSIPRGLTYELHGNDIVQSLLNRLEAATMEEMDDLEKKYVAYSETNPDDTEQIDLIELKRGQMGVRNLPYRNRLLKIIYQELSRGRWNDVPLVALTQALLKSDEPYILLQSPTPASDGDEWIKDYDIDQLCGNKKVFLDRILPHIYGGLTEDEVVLGAVFHSYSWTTDVEVVLDTVVRDRGFELVEAHEVTTMNGRAFALYCNDRFDPQNGSEPILRMTYKTGGMGEFINQCIFSYPSLLWTYVFGWHPSDNNPFLWLGEGEHKVWFEHLHGPVREIAQDQLHRQPFLQRWICSKETFEKISRDLNVTLTPVTSVNVKKMRY